MRDIQVEDYQVEKKGREYQIWQRFLLKRLRIFWMMFQKKK